MLLRSTCTSLSRIGEEIKDSISILGPIVHLHLDRAPLPYVQAYIWAMYSNHLGLLRLLAEQNFFECQSPESLNGVNNVKILESTTKRGNSEAMAIVLRSTTAPGYLVGGGRRMSTRLSVSTLRSVVNVADSSLSSARAMTNIDSIDAGVDNWQAIGVMFLTLQKINSEHQLTVTELQPIKLYADAMAGLLFAAVGGCTPQHQAVEILLKTGKYMQSTLNEAIDLFGQPDKRFPDWRPSDTVRLDQYTIGLLGRGIRTDISGIPGFIDDAVYTDNTNYVRTTPKKHRMAARPLFQSRYR